MVPHPDTMQLIPSLGHSLGNRILLTVSLKRTGLLSLNNMKSLSLRPRLYLGWTSARVTDRTVPVPSRNVAVPINTLTELPGGEGRESRRSGDAPRGGLQGWTSRRMLRCFHWSFY